MTTNTRDHAVVRGIVAAIDDDSIILGLPHTDYRLHLKLAVACDLVATPPGKRIRGTINAKAQKIHAAVAGGRFVEPVWGAPRIVQGMVLAIDEPANRVLIDVSVPMWVTVDDRQRASDFHRGQMLNFYVNSGTSFTPIRS